MLRAVLARLVAAGGYTTTADRLIDDLWEGNPPPTATSVLQVHIHNLRRVIEPDRPRRARSRYLISESAGYALRLAPESVDAWRFEALLRDYEERVRTGLPDPLDRRRLLDTMLACWNGAAYEGLTGFGWAAQEADRLTDLRLTAVEKRAELELELNRPTEVGIELRALFDEHPEREEIARLLATAQYRTGQQAQALTTLRRSREYLGQEYGIDPSPALRELETAILGHSESLAAGGVPSGPAPVARIRRIRESSGYRREHALLRETAAVAETRHLQMVWVAGEAGAGKTTLTESALADLAAQGWTFLRGGCPEVDGAPPAWAWAEVLTALDSAASGDLATGDAFTIARTVVALCTSRCANGPVAILLEDLHRADTATLQVLRQVVNWLRGRPVLLVVTLRGSEAGQALHATAAALAHHTAEWLELTGLDLDATRQLVRSTGLDDLGSAELERLHARTGGNPLFVREMAKLIAAQRSTGDRENIPDSIRELVSTRLRRLSPDVATALAHLAIWGDGADLRLLSVTSAITEDRLIDLIAEAEVAALVRTDRTGRITFDHALIRDTVYLGIPRLRRVRMHWAALELLENHADEFPGLARDPDMLAHHALLGARPETASRAIEYGLAAARRSTDRGMAADTARLWQSVAELHELAGHAAAHADRTDRVALLDARCALVDALAYQGRWTAASDARGQAVRLAREIGEPALLVRALTCWRAPILYPALEWRDPEHRLIQAVRECLAGEVTDADRVRLLAVAAYESAGDYRFPGRTRRFADEALAIARTCDDPELLCVAIAAGIVNRFTAAEDAALAHELFTVADRHQLSHFRTVGHYMLMRCALAAVDLREACRQAELAVLTTADAQLAQLMALMDCFPPVVAALRGDLPETERLYAELDDKLARLGFDEAGMIRAVPSLALAWARNTPADTVDRMHRMYMLAPGFGSAAYALALVHAGELDRAREIYLATADLQPEIAPSAEYTARAYVALALGLTEELSPLYRRLLPDSGTIVGLESTGATFGTMDTVLGLLAAAMGDAERAAAHHAASAELMRQVRAELADLTLPQFGSGAVTFPNRGELTPT
ncbi:BTAD domain-containing putative transcriptional regulator [Nocardia huaxiensis]|uniref:AAA family ATPase n=1 Tax=Nocardia huaxiensis TaxID=2755382 RepID=A0A7D6VDG3_9NOCA|nr:BTAD domain-containing putative transcriptional regulator [Nocardia huaxiensis]QLY32393.1 AAA family ATPase [Nocardia huaxiensis]UFS93896.1 AAA family ATPase [Nocardia huaxiensis]